MTRAWGIQFRNHLFAFIREPAAFVFNMIIPLFIVLAEAFAIGQTPIYATELTNLRVVDTLSVMSGIMYVMIVGLFGMSIGLSSMQESRALAGASLRPGGMCLVLSSYAACLLAMMVIGMSVAVAVLTLGWQVIAPAHLGLFVITMMLSAVLFLLIGAAIAGMVPSPRSAQGICSAFFFPLLFLSGAIFPLDSFPELLQRIATALPGFHVSELAFSAWLQGQPFPWPSLWYVLIGIVVIGGLNVVVYRRREGV